VQTSVFDFHGVRVAVHSGDGEPGGSLARDFSYFHRPQLSGAPHITIRCRAEEPPWADLPPARAVMIQPTCAVYDARGFRWVDYQSRALSRMDYRRESAEIWCRDDGLMHEIAYLLLLSRVGELHDRRGIHRIHALGLAVNGRGVICVLPSGGGKTTLGLLAMQRPGVRLLSDDTPLVDRRGDLLPFPTRIGLCSEPPSDIPRAFVRRFRRREHGAKWLVDIEAFGDRLATPCAPAAVVIGERSLGGAARLEAIPRRQAMGSLMRHAVAGLGLPQLVEYFLRMDVLDPFRKAPLVASRTAACAALLRRSQAYRLTLGRDADESAALLHRVCQQLGADDPPSRRPGGGPG